MDDRDKNVLKVDAKAEQERTKDTITSVGTQSRESKTKNKTS